MTLQINQKLTGLNTKKTFTVKKFLGAGGQGEVWLVEDEQKKEFALKWYFPDKATSEQERTISNLLNNYRITKVPEAAKRFVCPIDLVKPSVSQQFGYIMDKIDRKKYIEMGEFQGRGKQLPFSILAEIGYQLANSYKALHLEGLCYCDISKGNVLFDQSNGNILICDNDNVGVNGQTEAQVQGTWEFMAPEVILGKSNPSTQTDLHSLAVFLFWLWTFHHPFHGNLESNIRSWDIPAKKKVYGENPVFIFDPNNKSNRPDDPDYSTVRTLWERCPKSLKELFTQAFAKGAVDPSKRVQESTWQRAFLQLKENNIECPHCKKQGNLWSSGEKSVACLSCKQPIQVPGYISINNNLFSLALVPGMKLRAFHLSASSGSGRGDGDTMLGELVANPANPGQWGIRNHTQDTWKITFPDGTSKDVPSGKAAPLSNKAFFNVKGIKIEIVLL